MRRLAAKTGEAGRAWRAREGVLRRGGDGDDDGDDDERVRNSCRNWEKVKATTRKDFVCAIFF